MRAKARLAEKENQKGSVNAQEEKDSAVVPGIDARSGLTATPCAPNFSETFPVVALSETLETNRWQTARCQLNTNASSLYRIVWDLKVLLAEMTLKKTMLERKLANLEAEAADAEAVRLARGLEFEKISSEAD